LDAHGTNVSVRHPARKGGAPLSLNPQREGKRKRRADAKAGTKRFRFKKSKPISNEEERKNIDPHPGRLNKKEEEKKKYRSQST